MKILTYNVWDSPQGMPQRTDHIVCTLAEQAADVLCLQEVNENCLAALRERMQELFILYDAESEIAIMSKFALEEAFRGEYAVCALADTPLGKAAVCNVHLPWEGALKRECAIAKIVRRLEDVQADQVLLLGDFNCSPQSSVHRFLKGEQSLMDREACYFDLAESMADISGIPAENTLDFRQNPRFRQQGQINTVEISHRFDRIMLRNPYPRAFPILGECAVFGKHVWEETALASSDHYGVSCVLTFQENA